MLKIYDLILSLVYVNHKFEVKLISILFLINHKNLSTSKKMACSVHSFLFFISTDHNKDAGNVCTYIDIKDQTRGDFLSCDGFSICFHKTGRG